MNVMVTGANGYVGYNLGHYLQKKGHRIIEIDKTLGSPAEKLREKDCYKVDAIVHLAAMAGIKDCEANIVMAVNDNVISAENVFRMGYALDIPVVFTSSQAAKKPTNTYGVLKNVCEQLAINLNVNVLRLSNVFGGEQYLQMKNSVIAKFVNAKILGNPITIHGNGEQTRDFIHVDEVCRAIELCLKKYKVFVDIGTGMGRTVNTLVKMLQHKVEDIGYLPDSVRVGINSSIADIKPAMNMLGFVAQDKLTQYLQKFI